MYREEIMAAEPHNRVAPGFLGMPRAAAMAQAARKKYEQHANNELAHIVPLYIRPPDAEVTVRGGKGSFNPVV